MVSLIASLFKLFCTLIYAAWMYFTEYIEFADAIMTGLIVRSYALDWGLGSTVGTVSGIAVGILFLVIFKTSKAGWCIATAVFSFAWAGFIADIIREFIAVNAVVYWLIVAGFTAYFAWLHYYALDREESHKRYQEQQYARTHPRKAQTEPDVSATTSRELKELERQINMAAERKRR